MAENNSGNANEGMDMDASFAPPADESLEQFIHANEFISKGAIDPTINSNDATLEKLEANGKDKVRNFDADEMSRKTASNTEVAPLTVDETIRASLRQLDRDGKLSEKDKDGITNSVKKDMRERDLRWNNWDSGKEPGPRMGKNTFLSASVQDRKSGGLFGVITKVKEDNNTWSFRAFGRTETGAYVPFRDNKTNQPVKYKTEEAAQKPVNSYVLDLFVRENILRLAAVQKKEQEKFEGKQQSKNDLSGNILKSAPEVSIA